MPTLRIFQGETIFQTTEIHQLGRNCCSATNAFGQFVPSERFPGLEWSGKDPSPKYVQDVLIILINGPKIGSSFGFTEKIQRRFRSHVTMWCFDPTQFLLQSNKRKTKAFFVRTFKSRPIIGAADSVGTISLPVDSFLYVGGYDNPPTPFPLPKLHSNLLPLVLGGCTLVTVVAHQIRSS